MKLRNVTNKNEFTKEEFDKFVDNHNLEVIEEKEMYEQAKKVAGLIKKSEQEDLEKSEQDEMEFGKIELKHLYPMYVNSYNKDMGIIQKSLVYVRPKQTEETFEKSEDGSKQEVFADTELNKALDRVGELVSDWRFNDNTIEKGKKENYDDEQGKVPGEQDTGPDEYDEESDEYKAMYDMVQKGMGRKDILAKMKKAYPKMDDKKMKGMIKACNKKAYNKQMEKAMEYKKKMEEEEKENEE